MENEIFQRTELLLGNDLMQKIRDTRVIVFGVGGVGSWCVESLVRSGIGHLTIVDYDCVCPTNINRQLPATTQTIGQTKVDVLKDRLLAINPKVEINAIRQFYNADTAESFNIGSYDYIIDAIDSLTDKAHLIVEACKTDATLFSSMGAALKMNPAKIQTTEFWKVQGCPLAAALRRKFKKGEKPTKKFRCVFSDELLRNKGVNFSEKPNEITDIHNIESSDQPETRQPNGTVAHITAIFGFTLAGLVIQSIAEKS